MALNKLYITGVPGQAYVEHPDLNEAAEVILVLRNGKLRVETDDTPTGKEFKHDGPNNRIVFDEEDIMSGLEKILNPNTYMGPKFIYVGEIVYVEFKN